MAGRVKWSARSMKTQNMSVREVLQVSEGSNMISSLLNFARMLLALWFGVRDRLS